MKNHIRESISELIESTDLGSRTDRIFVIGKGPSLDELEGFGLPPGLVINVNDSEKVIQGDICVFSSNWVRHSLKERGFKCGYYIGGKPLPGFVKHEVLPAIPLEYDSDELLLYRFELDSYFDEHFVLANALKVSCDVARVTGKKPEVYLLGFDFSTEKGQVSKAIGVDFAQSEDVDRSLVVHSQEFDYVQFVRYFQSNPKIQLIHVGVKEYSTLTPQQFKEKFSRKYEFGFREPQTIVSTSLENKVLVVAELTNNHLGDVARLVEMVERAKEAGADLIKVQKRDVNSFYSEKALQSFYWSPFGKTLGDYRRGVELDEGKLAVLNQTCKSLQIGWFCSVLDYASFKLMMKFEPTLIKIPSTISNHQDFHRQVASEYSGPIVISTGFTDQSYEEYVLNTFKDNERIYLLHCISAYPTSLQDCNIAVVKHYSELAKLHSNLVPGYSSHDLGSFASVLAVAGGARMVEKHVKLGDVDWVHFDKVAVDLKTDGFRNYVSDVRQAEAALGSPVKRILPTEHHKYEVVKR